jgi:mono/diheme cytochrome c family protein
VYAAWVPPVRQPNRPHDLRLPFGNRQLILGWRTLSFQEGEYLPNPTKSAEWNRGAYLVEGLGHCAMCHSPINALGGSSEIEGVRGRADPDAELVCPLAHLEQGGRARRVEVLIVLASVR